jgi:hypothetical protein
MQPLTVAKWCGLVAIGTIAAVVAARNYRANERLVLLIKEIEALEEANDRRLAMRRDILAEIRELEKSKAMLILSNDQGDAAQEIRDLVALGAVVSTIPYATAEGGVDVTAGAAAAIMAADIRAKGMGNEAGQLKRDMSDAETAISNLRTQKGTFETSGRRRFIVIQLLTLAAVVVSALPSQD